mmetsp:Transcript_6586/g.19432  ORF Transcript_6586/g.19432 Transcript_6586/m.19432 type:complete len:215 (+) Transcript_6586:306-950(+)
MAMTAPRSPRLIRWALFAASCAALMPSGPQRAQKTAPAPPAAPPAPATLRRPRPTLCRPCAGGLEFSRLFIDGAAGLAGGSMGVMGTLAVYERNRYHAKQRVACAYCEGTGAIQCATCLGTGVVAVEGGTAPCTTCRGGKHSCVNCEGTGLSIPETLERKDIKQQDDELERQLDEIGIAALANDIVRAENSPEDMKEVTRMIQRRALARMEKKR